MPLTSDIVAWALMVQELEGPLEPPAGDRADLVIGLDAPELAPAVLLGIGDLAALLGESRATIDSRVVRGRLPTYQLVIDGARRWARPIVEHWLGEHRLGRSS